MTLSDQGGELRFGVLGSFECTLDGVPVPLRGPRQERLAVYLLLNHDRVALISRLVEAVWDDGGPATAPHQVRKMVSDLRMRLAPFGDQLTTSGAGYRLSLGSARLDLDQFRETLRLAQAATGGQPAATAAVEQAVTHLRDALDLWRGPILEGNGGLVIDAASEALEEHRVAALERRFELLLALGRFDGLVGELRDAVNQYPARERLREQLMLALYLSGNQGEAFDEYHSIRRLLYESYGVDPGPGLTSLYQRFLENDGTLSARGFAPDPVAAHVSAGAQVPIATTTPNTLPYVVPDFTGRARALEELYAAAGADGATHPHVRIVVVNGMGGSGKSTLAIHAAHRLSGQYPAGQLYIDFKSYRAGSTPLDAHQALGISLSALGVAESTIPSNPAARAATWRAVTSGRRLLILIDNVASGEDIPSMIPNCSGSLVLVTSRDRILGLDGARHIRLGMLTAGESIEMLERFLGHERVRAELEPAAALARLCGHLPLALRISAARLADKEHRSIGWLTERLADVTGRLEVLSTNERSVTASIRSSEQSLRPEYCAALRLLSLHPGESFDVHAACSLLGGGEIEVEQTLEVLLDRHLLEPRPKGCYGIHDLVRAYALRHQDCRDLDDGRLDEALSELLAYYAVVSGTASDVVFDGRNRYNDRMPTYTGSAPDLASHSAAIAWFDSEHRTAHTLIRTAAARGLHAHVAHISRNLALYLHLRDLSEQFYESAVLAEEACRALDSPALLSNALVNLAIALWRRGQVEEGIGLLSEALELAERQGDTLSSAVCLSRLGAFRHTLGENETAAQDLRQAVGLLAGLGRTREEALTRISLCGTLLDLGCFAEAAQQARSAAEFCRAERHRHPQVMALADHGKALIYCGRAAEAVAVLNSARDLARTLHSGRPQTALVMANLAQAYLTAGQSATAAIYAEQAGRLLADAGKSVPALWAGVLNTLGRVHFGLGERTLAAERHEEALALARDSRYALGEARALAGLATSCEDPDGAEAYRGRAQEIFDQRGVAVALRGLC